MKGYKGIIFDLDGTLLNTLEDLTDAVNVTMVKFGIEEKTISQVRSYVGNGVAQLIALCLEDGVAHPDYQAVHDAFVSYYDANCNHKTGLYDGVDSLLASLHQEGRKLAIVSNKIDSAVKILNKLYFSQWIDFALGVTDHIKRKPAPDMVLHCIEDMKLAPHEVVYVGDSEVDLQTARNAGIDCISVDWGFRDRDCLNSNGASIIVSDAVALEKVIGGKKEPC